MYGYLTEKPEARAPELQQHADILASAAPVHSARPVLRSFFIPVARWDHRPDGALWTRAAIRALKTHGRPILDTVPRDIAAWCPAYPQADLNGRAAFWTGMMSALAKHESTYRPTAVGGPNLWYGLLQIYPDTARRYGCRATTGEALKDPEDNLSCAIRIMNVTVPRDDVIAVRDTRWRGVAADWGPMTKPSKIAEMSAWTNRAKIAEMSAWTRRQDYCVSRRSIRPQARPLVQATLSTMSDG